MATLTEADAILQAIREDPADDLPRLAFADWCDENGQADRAGFIRDQVLWLPGSNDIDLLDANLEAWFGWFGRHDELGFTRIADGLKVIHASCETTNWTRGFVSSINLPANAFMEHAKALFGADPITEVKLSDRWPSQWVYDFSEAGFRDNPPPGFIWNCHIDDEINLPSFLPAEVFALLSTKGTLDASRAGSLPCAMIIYPIQTAAEGALSAAAVAWGRGKVNLSPLA